jgi:hypothetical protein
MPRLSFPKVHSNRVLKIIDDAFDTVSEGGQNHVYGVTFQCRLAAERYVAGELKIHLVVGIGLEQPNCEFVLGAIPPVRENLYDSPGSDHLDEAGIRAGDEGQRMLGIVGDLAESNNLVTAASIGISSRIWLQTPEEIVQFDGIFRGSFSLRNVPESGFQGGRVRRDGEMNIASVTASESANCGRSAVVEGMFEVPKSVTRQFSDPVRDLSKPHLEELVACFRVDLAEDGGCVICEVPVGCRMQLFDVFTSPPQ